MNNIDNNTDFFQIKDNFEVYSTVESILIYGQDQSSFPLVTIAIPTYQRPHLLKDAIDSALFQENFSDYEIIIVDNENVFDVETATEKLIKSYSSDKIKYYKNQQNIGAFGNWNRCFELAKGKWVTLLHDDDSYFPFYIAEMVSIIQKHPQIELLKSKQLQWEDDGTENINDLYLKYYKKRKGYFRKISNKEDFYASPLKPTGIFLKKENVIKLGGYNPDFYPSADNVFTSLYCYEFNAFYYNKVLGIYRWKNNTTLNIQTLIDMAIIKYYFQQYYGNKIGIPSTLLQIDVKYNIVFYASNLKLIHMLYPMQLRKFFSDFSWIGFFLYMIIKKIKIIIFN
jgi:glycosyltransferase involved in cell wall biosynthesis